MGDQTDRAPAPAAAASPESGQAAVTKAPKPKSKPKSKNPRAKYRISKEPSGPFAGQWIASDRSTGAVLDNKGYATRQEAEDAVARQVRDEERSSVEGAFNESAEVAAQVGDLRNELKELQNETSETQSGTPAPAAAASPKPRSDVVVKLSDGSSATFSIAELQEGKSRLESERKQLQDFISCLTKKGTK